MACINTNVVFGKARHVLRKGTENKAGSMFMALHKSMASSHGELCARLCFLLFRKEMLELEKDNKDAWLSGFVPCERKN